MTRNVVGRRAFLRHASTLAAGVSCASFAGLQDALGLATPSRSPGTGVLRMVSRPFNMLAFGDSIMWGQGLTENLKFATLVKNWVNTQLPGRGVSFQNLAHSGAIIQPNLVADVFGAGEGEVPASYPSIHRQVHRAYDAMLPSKANLEVDLVLLNGGANDVGITNILNPLASSGSVRDLTRAALADRMKYLLPIAAGLFPNAKFVVPGYYPIITHNTPLLELTGLLLGLGVLDPLSAVLVTVGVKDQLIANCSTFFAEADAGLRAAVAEQNGRTPDRCVYADPGFTPYNGYGGSDRCLFNVAENDPMKSVRAVQCAAVGELPVSKCATASMGHPNASGALRYANAMTARLGGFLSGWQGLRTLFACVDPKPVIGATGSYTVWVEDGATRLPVAAAVAIGTRTVAANASFTHSFACTAPESETLDGPRGRPGRTIAVPAACEEIRVNAPGYIPMSVR